MSHWVKEYVGKPYRSGAYGPDAFDCWGLVRDVWMKHLGADVPVFGANMGQRHINELLTSPWCWAEEVHAPSELDVVLMGRNRPVHIGIYVVVDRKPQILHSLEEATGVVLTPLLNLSLCHGIQALQFYRYKR